MNEHYKNALVAAELQRLRKEGVSATEEDIRNTFNYLNFTGNWDEDIEILHGECLDLVEDDGEEDCHGPLENVAACKKNVEDHIDEVVATLKVGYNFIPGIGAGWCRNEEDLEKMRDFVRGALTVQAMQGGSCGCPCCDD